MPYAKAVSAKSCGFGADGNDTATDYHHMMKIVLDAGYRGHVGIEYEGRELKDVSGIHATHKLLRWIRQEYTVSRYASVIAAQYFRNSQPLA